MRVSIVILNWNGGEVNCLESVRSAYNQEYTDKEIIFVDNASSDGSGEAVLEQFPDICFVQTGENVGCPSGRNIGARHASGELIAFLENDGVWKTKDVISEAVEFMVENSDVGVIFTAVEGYDSRLLDPPLDFHGQHVISLSSSFRGGASIVRGDLFEQLGGFPDDFFRQYEERYFSFLVYDMGYKVVYWPEKVLRHKGSDYVGKVLQVSRFNFTNEMRTIIRIMPAVLLFRLLPLKLVVNAVRFILSGDIRWFISGIMRLPKEFGYRRYAPKISVKTYRNIMDIRYGKFVKRVSTHR